MNHNYKHALAEVGKASKLFMVRTSKENMTKFLANGFVGIGWGKTGDLSGASADQIQELLEREYQFTGHNLIPRKGPLGVISNVSTLKTIVIVPVNGSSDAHIGVLGDYYYDSSDMDLAHCRKVGWLLKINRETLSSGLKQSLKSSMAAADITKHLPALIAEIERLAGIAPESDPVPFINERADSHAPIAADEMIEVEYPLRAGGVKAFITLPADTTKQEAKRLAEMVETLYYRD